MKTAYMIMSLFVLSAVVAAGQSIADRLKVAECSFKLFDGPTELEVLDQMVTKRAVRNSNPEIRTFGSAYHIEFMYRGDELTLNNAVIEFLDKDKRPLHAITAESESRFMNVTRLGNRPHPKVRFIAISL
jgi:hypothetical protein